MEEPWTDNKEEKKRVKEKKKKEEAKGNVAMHSPQMIGNEYVYQKKLYPSRTDILSSKTYTALFYV